MTKTQPHIGDLARTRPDATALVMSDGSGALSFRQLDDRSHALAGQMRAAGVLPGDHVAILMENRPEFMVAAWAAHRSGLHYTTVNWHLKAAEVAYIVTDSGAKILIAGATVEPLAQSIMAECPGVALWHSDKESPSGFAPDGATAPPPVTYSQLEGAPMIYSSGTSGRPKGIVRELSGEPFGVWTASDAMMHDAYEFGPHTVLLVASPLYHAAPLNFSLSAQRAGGRVVVMPSFDPEAMLDTIARERVTTAFIVPTMMIRMLRLPDARRAAADLHSLTHIVHSGAPCPVKVKRAMLDWWGPVLHEFYGATEGNGVTMIGPLEWLAHPGSVGRSDMVRIVGEDGSVLGTDEIGEIYFASAWNPFQYHNDPVKTAEARNAQGWTTIGDIGYLDSAGYLFLTDRKSHMIISGGVNIYPQEAENILIGHPAVADVAVLGVPNTDLGEEVKAVVELVDPSKAGPALADEIVNFCRERLAHFKCPRSVDFVEALPRMPTGKLMKREVRNRYWPAAT